MKPFYLTLSLLIVFINSYAGTCYVQQANPQSVKKYLEIAEIVIEQNEKGVEVVLTLPSEIEGYALNRAFLVIESETNDQYELFVPVATDANLDEESSKALLLLPIDVFERADLVVNYGRCALEYHLKLNNWGQSKN